MAESESKARPDQPASIGQPTERPGLRVPDHDLVQRIGRGAYGEVWLARNVVGTYRAVKVVHRDSFKDRTPYEREYRGIQKFEPISRSNDGFVDILQIGRNDEQGYFYYVMELADAMEEKEKGGKAAEELAVARGEIPSAPVLLFPAAPYELTTYVPKTLRSEIQRRGRLPFEECLRYALSLNLALGHLPRHGLITRDITPSNIIFVNGVPKLADIGLVTEVEEARSYVGTEGFIPPEGPNSPRADIYSLGKVLYEMSMGKDRTEFPEPFTALGQSPDSPELEELNVIILKACATNPRERYQSAEEMHVDFALLQSGRSVKSKQLLERRLAFARKAGALVGAVAAVAVVAFLYQRFQTREARRLAQAETFQRTRAEGLLSTLQLKEAEHFFENDEAGKGVAYLARMLRENPSNHIAALRLMSALTDRNFALPLRVFQHTNSVQGLEFSPDGQRIVTCGGDDTTGGVATIWNARAGEPVGKPMRHNKSVLEARFSPDGHLVATASRDGTARLWEAATGEALTAPLTHEKSPNGEPAQVRQVRFNPDGQILLTFSGSQACVWKVPSGESVKSIDHGSRVVSGQFSPDGQRILTADRATTKVWDATTGRLQFALRTGSVGDGALARFSPDGSVIAAADFTDVHIWSATTGGLLRVLQHEAAVVSLAFSPDGLRIAAGDLNRTARLWDVETGQPLIPPLTQRDIVGDLQFDPTGERILTLEFRRARIWDSRTGRPLSEWIAEIEFARFSPDGLQLLAKDPSGDGKTAMLWDVGAGQALNVALWHKDVVSSARFSKDGKNVVTSTGGNVFPQTFGHTDGEVAVWDVRTGERVVPRITIPMGVNDAEFSPDGRRMVTASKNSQARIWDAQSGAAVTEPLQHSGPVVRARFSPDGRKVVTASEDKTVRVWDAQTGQPLTDPWLHTNSVLSAEFSPDGRWILTATSQAVTPAHIWDADTGQVRFDLPHGEIIRDARFSRDGTRIVTASSHRTAQLWNSETGQRIGEAMGHQDEVLVACFSPDGRLVVTGSADQTARIWDAQTGKPLTEPLVHQGMVIAVGFSRDSRRVVTASTDHTARVWEAQPGRPLTELLRHNDWVAYAEFSPDGTRVITASLDGTARIWELAPSEVPMPVWVLDLAEAAVCHRLSEQEVLQPVSPIQFMAVKERASQAHEADRYTAWAKWLVADRRGRTTSPSSGVTAPTHLERQLQQKQGHFSDYGFIALREAIRLAPDSAVATARLARDLLSQDDRKHPHKTKEAELLSVRAIQLGPKEPEAWRARAEVLAYSGRLDEALRAIQQAVALDAGDPTLWTLKGELLAKIGRNEDALRACSQAVNLSAAGGDTAREEAERAVALKCALFQRAKLLARLGRFEESGNDNLQARGIPPQAPRTQPALIDLSAYYNLSLEDNVEPVGLVYGKDTLVSLPRGVHGLGGVEFDLRGAIRVFNPPGNTNRSARIVPGMRVTRRCQRLHFLHSARLYDPIGGPFGRYTVHYEDGAREEIPIEMGKTIGNWIDVGPAGEADLVWQDANDLTPVDGNVVRLFKLSWVNPRPDVAITSIDLEWLEDVPGHLNNWDALLLVAITAEDEPPLSIIRQPQRQKVRAGESVVFAVEVSSEAPFVCQWQFNGTDIPGATNTTLAMNTVTPAQAGTYRARIRHALADPVLTATSELAPLVVEANELNYGALRCEVFTNVSGGELRNLTNHSRFPANPDAVGVLHQFEIPSNRRDKYGVRLTGYLVPPKTGDYRFYLCSDDEGALFLSTDDSPENRRRIAHEPEWNASRLWTTAHGRPRRENISEPIHLEAGRRYYVEALMKESVGGDNLAVTWQMPGEPPPQNLSPPIPGTYLAVPVDW